MPIRFRVAFAFLLACSPAVAAPAGSRAMALLARPLGHVRFQGTMLYGQLPPGLRSGGAPRGHGGIAPSLAVDLGHYLDESANDRLRDLGVFGPDAKGAFDDLGYAFASATVGIEVGDPERFVLYARAGLSRLAFDSAVRVGRSSPRGPCSEGAVAQVEHAGGALMMVAMKVGFLLRF